MKNINLTREDIINRLGYYRNKKNMPAHRLSLELGRSGTYYYKVERGEISLSVETLLDALEILGVSTFEFFYPDLENFEKDTKYLDLVNSLTDEERELILAFLKVKDKK